MKWDFRSTISGARRGPLAMLARLGLRLASLPYGWAVSLRNRKYDSGKLPIHECGVPVISVGNLTTGGTGKTPIVCYLAKQFRNCLLYTSPSPRDRTRSRMPSSA